MVEVFLLVNFRKSLLDAVVADAALLELGHDAQAPPLFEPKLTPHKRPGKALFIQKSVEHQLGHDLFQHITIHAHLE